MYIYICIYVHISYGHYIGIIVRIIEDPNDPGNIHRPQVSVTQCWYYLYTWTRGVTQRMLCGAGLRARFLREPWNG